MIKTFKMWSINALLIYLCAFLTCTSNTLFAKEYLIGVEDISYYPFYDFSAKQTDQKSFTKELISVFFTYKNYKFKFVPLPVKRFDKWFVEESIDFKFPDNTRWRTEESKTLNITYSEPVLHLIAGSYVLAKNQSLSQDAIKRLGTVYGFYPTLWIDRVQNNTIEIVELRSTFSIVKHLIYGNVDAVNIDKNVINHALKSMGKPEDIIALNKKTKHERFAFHFSSILHPKIIQEFNHFLNTHSEQIAELKNKYGIIETPEN